MTTTHRIERARLINDTRADGGWLRTRPAPMRIGLRDVCNFVIGVLLGYLTIGW